MPCKSLIYLFILYYLKIILDFFRIFTNDPNEENSKNPWITQIENQSRSSYNDVDF